MLQIFYKISWFTKYLWIKGNNLLYKGKMKISPRPLALPALPDQPFLVCTLYSIWEDIKVCKIVKQQVELSQKFYHCNMVMTKTCKMVTIVSTGLQTLNSTVYTYGNIFLIAHLGNLRNISWKFELSLFSGLGQWFQSRRIGFWWGSWQ